VLIYKNLYLTELLIYVKVIKNNKTYLERWRDWPFETRQPAVSYCPVLIPAGRFLKDKELINYPLLLLGSGIF